MGARVPMKANFCPWWEKIVDFWLQPVRGALRKWLENERWGNLRPCWRTRAHKARFVKPWQKRVGVTLRKRPENHAWGNLCPWRIQVWNFVAQAGKKYPTKKARAWRMRELVPMKGNLPPWRGNCRILAQSGKGYPMKMAGEPCIGKLVPMKANLCPFGTDQ